MATFSKKAPYHSELREVSEQNGIWLRPEGTPKDSKYKDKPAFVSISVSTDGGEVDPQKYTLNVENDAIRAHLAALTVGQWYLVKAHGARDDAYLEIADSEGNPVPAPSAPLAGTAPPAGPPSAPPVTRQQSAPPAGAPPSEQGGDAIAKELVHALLSAARIVEYVEQKLGREITENDRALAATIFIETNRRSR